MSERPILFKKAMYDAINEGRKTQTRRIVKLPDSYTEMIITDRPSICLKFDELGFGDSAFYEDVADKVICSPYQKGDLIWVREPFTVTDCIQERKRIGLYYKYNRRNTFYKSLTDDEWDKFMKWEKPINRGMPSIFMFKSLTRLWLEVTDVRLERLQDITDGDAMDEGIPDKEALSIAGPEGYKACFSGLWDSINKDRASWASNPYVWVVEFKKK